MQVPGNSGRLATHPLSLSCFFCVRVMGRPPQGAAGRIKGLGNNDCKALASAQNIIKHWLLPSVSPLSGWCQISSDSLQLYPPALHQLMESGKRIPAHGMVRIQGTVELTRRGR